MTENLKNDELKIDELEQAAGGFIKVSDSQGSRCVDISIGNSGIWLGAAGAGWYSGDRAGRF